MFSAATVLTSLVPLVQYIGKAAVDRWIGAPKPTPEEITARGNADAAAIQGIAQMEASYGPVHPWVNNIRALQRPVVVGGVLLTWITLSLAIAFDQRVNPAVYYTVCEISSAVFFYLFGQRTLIYFDNNWFKGLKNGK